eukprot:1194268-Prorocentrum_minimum.AAC.2
MGRPEQRHFLLLTPLSPPSHPPADGMTRTAALPPSPSSSATHRIWIASIPCSAESPPGGSCWPGWYIPLPRARLVGPAGIYPSHAHDWLARLVYTPPTRAIGWPGWSSWRPRGRECSSCRKSESRASPPHVAFRLAGSRSVPTTLNE